MRGANAFMRFANVFHKVRLVVVAITSATVHAFRKIFLHAAHDLSKKDAQWKSVYIERGPNAMANLLDDRVDNFHHARNRFNM